MTPNIEKYIGTEAVKEAISQNKYNDECCKEFIRELDRFLTSLEKSDDIEEEDTPSKLLEVPVEYANYYAKRRNEGFSVAWSKLYAKYKTTDDIDNLLVNCYEAVEEQNKQQANADLMTYFKVTNRTQVYIDYFLMRMALGDRYVENSLEKDVEEFEVNYNEQIHNGKSEIYAWQYADQLAYNYHPIFCEDYAYIYDESIKKGKSKEYAREYANKYASELVNVKRRYGKCDDKEALEYAKLKALVYINGWEYAKNNNLKDNYRFIECFENSYMNTYFSDNPNEWKTLEECEKIALDKALEKYRKN